MSEVFFTNCLNKTHYFVFVYTNVTIHTISCSICFFLLLFLRCFIFGFSYFFRIHNSNVGNSDKLTSSVFSIHMNVFVYRLLKPYGIYPYGQIGWWILILMKVKLKSHNYITLELFLFPLFYLMYDNTVFFVSCKMKTNIRLKHSVQWCTIERPITKPKKKQLYRLFIRYT